jgi:hypothetical protein
MKAINYTVKATLKMKDGILPGQIKVKAASLEHAVMVATAELNVRWTPVSIEIVNVRKG